MEGREQEMKVKKKKKKFEEKHSKMEKESKRGKKLLGTHKVLISVILGS